MLKNYSCAALLLLLSAPLYTQTPTDMEFVPKGFACAGVNYSYNAWSKYWEGDISRENGNVGTVSRQQFGAGIAIGIIDPVNLIIQLPYTITKASQGTLNGQNGLQDISLNLKARYADLKLGSGKLAVGGNFGFSTPVSKYLVDFAPLNLGSGTTNLSYRQLITYKLDEGFYVGARANYIYRSNISNIHRDFYFDQGEAHYSNEVKVDDVLEWNAALGYTNNNILAEIDYNAYNTLGGSDIRIWDPGFPTNDSDFSSISARFDYYISKSQGLNFSVTGGYTLSGKNAGQATFGSVGINYLFRAWGRKSEQK